MIKKFMVILLGFCLFQINRTYTYSFELIDGDFNRVCEIIQPGIDKLKSDLAHAKKVMQKDFLKTNDEFSSWFKTLNLVSFSRKNELVVKLNDQGFKVSGKMNMSWKKTALFVGGILGIYLIYKAYVNSISDKKDTLERSCC